MIKNYRLIAQLTGLMTLLSLSGPVVPRQAGINAISAEATNSSAYPKTTENSADNPGHYQPVVIVTTTKRQMKSEFVKSLTDKLHAKKLKAIVEHTDSLTSRTLPENALLHVAMGYRALRTLSDINSASPVLSLFTSRKNFEKIVNNVSGNRLNAKAIYYDAPLVRQIALIRRIFPKARAIGYLSPVDSEPEAVKAMAVGFDFSIVSKPVTDPSMLIKSLLTVTKNSDVILSQRESRIYSPENTKTIILTAYRHNKAIVGNSLSHLRLGHMATVFTSPGDILEELSDMLEADSFNSLPASKYSKYFSIKVNYGVARSLNMHLPSEDVLKNDVSALLAHWNVHNE